MTLSTNKLLLTYDVRRLLDYGKNHDDSTMAALYCEEGKVAMTINDKRVDLPSHSLFIGTGKMRWNINEITADLKFTLLVVNTEVVRKVLFESFRMEPRWWDKQEYMTQHPIIELSAYQEEFIHGYANMFNIFMRDPDQTPYRLRIMHGCGSAIAMEILNHYEKVLSKEGPNYNRAGITQSDYLFHDFLKMMQDYPHEREVQWFASRLSITPKYLSEVCKARSGKSASEWIVTNTIAEAQNLLQNTSDSIKDIADIMKFPNSSFFCQYIKKHTGMTPVKLRRK